MTMNKAKVPKTAPEQRHPVQSALPGRAVPLVPAWRGAAQRLLALLLLFAMALGVQAQLSDAERHAKAAELKKLQARIQAIAEQRSAVHSKYDKVQKQLRQVDREIGRQARALKKIDRRIAGQKRKLAELHKKQTRLTEVVNRQRDLLGSQIRAAYMIGRQEYLKLVLNQEDPTAMGRVFTYYRYFNQARRERIEAVLTSLAELQAVTAQLEVESKKLTQSRQEQLAKKRSLLKQKKQRRKVMAQLKKDLQSKDQQIALLREDENKLTSLLDAIEDILTAPDDRDRFVDQRGQLSWPVRGKVRNLYGKHRQSSKLKWNGVLISAAEGSNVRAVARGRVAYADWLRGYGLLLILDHGDGYMSLYGYNQSLLREVGEWVETGDVLATVGKSGGQQDNALYFEIRHKGKPANPARWCSRKRRSARG